MRVLILSHAINMDGRAASQTVTDKIPYLQSAGFDLTVVSAITGDRSDRYKHIQVLPLTPVALRFDLRHHFQKTFARGSWRYRLASLTSTLVLGLPLVIERLINRVESQTSWSVPAFLVAWWVHRTERFDVVLSSGGAISAHVAGYWLKKYLQLPWVAEIHDPLVYEGWDKSGAQLRLSQWLEERICTCANAAVWFTNQARDRAHERHPQLAGRGHVVYAGVDKPQLPKNIGTPQSVVPHFVFAHFGSLSSTRSLRYFLGGLEKYLEENPGDTSLIRVEIYGGSLDAESLIFIRSCGLEQVVVQIGRLERDQDTGRSGRDRVMQRMTEVDCLILLHGQQPVCEEYIPSKLYEYLWMGPTVLGAVWNNPELESILLAQGHMAIRADDTDQYAIGISMLLSTWKSMKPSSPARSSPYTAKRSSESLIAILGMAGSLSTP
jgi:hypothetical protein